MEAKVEWYDINLRRGIVVDPLDVSENERES